MTFLSAFKNTSLLWVLMLWACAGPLGNAKKSAENDELVEKAEEPPEIIVGANQTQEYIRLLRDKKVAVVANQTSVIFTSKDTDSSYVHLVDSLVSSGIDVKKVFAPEHGFRGRADAGEAVADGIDKKTGLPIVSLYGTNKKPSPEQLANVDIVLFDIQDIGVRFYTYIATLQLVMEASAALNIPVVILDRPNPNANYVDGPSMEPENFGFLGLTPIPLVYGMTIGEYATMINEEGWLTDGLKADIRVIPLKNYTHQSDYILPIRPSPNIPNAQSVNLYPSLGLFEGTNINAGRGTEFQFQRFGAPFLDQSHFEFNYKPQSNFGAKHPKHKDEICYGKDLSKVPKLNSVELEWLIEAYNHSSDQTKVFNTKNFTRHAGTADLQKQIEAGRSAEEIKKSWEKDLTAFKKIRAKYLIYE